MVALAASVVGYAWGPTQAIERGLLFVASLLLISPDRGADLAGLGLAGIAIAWQWRRRRAVPRPAPAPR